MQKRQTEDFLEGKLEFPGGKIEPYEKPAEAAVRELREETNVSVSPSEIDLFDVVTHHYEEKTVKLYVFLLTSKVELFQKGGWYGLNGNWQDELGQHIPPANYGILNKLLAEVASG
ncbi:MAG: hypothetical protein CME64_04710 [Halobacteriovoraceae bacterium]|nr:hypothetical protein [Halobacteriovoraceae bacterium]|tara:strand:- start:233585 stop:233932 length:348 start_codon:yes stop_codon:yes gene_type:complete